MKGHWTVSILVSILILGSLGLSQQAFAFPTSVTFVDDPNCDPLFVETFVDELGTAPAFTPLLDEGITAVNFSNLANLACPTSSIPATNLIQVLITNTVVPCRMDNRLIHMQRQSVLLHRETGLVITILLRRSLDCFSQVLLFFFVK